MGAKPSPAQSSPGSALQAEKGALVLEGNDIGLVSSSVALTKQAAAVTNKDIRTCLGDVHGSEKGTARQVGELRSERCLATEARAWIMSCGMLVMQ